MNKFVITHINKDGMRQITGANQGHRFWNNRLAAQDQLDLMLNHTNDRSFASCYGAQAVGTFEVREVECYEGGDAKSIYFDTDRDLGAAITHWDALADGKAVFAQAISPLDASMGREAVRDSMQARAVANALRMEVKTGIPHCSCKNPPHPVA